MNSESPGPSPDTSPADASEATPETTAPKQENALLNLLLNVLLPVTVLSMCSKQDTWYGLGPKWALIVAVTLPLGYFIYDFVQRRKINALSIIGIVSVLLTGGLGLLNLSATVFAWKEASVPLILAGVIFFTGCGKKSLVRQILLNPDIVNIRKLDKALDAHQSREAFDRLLKTSTWLLTASMLLSAVLNYFLAIYFLKDTVPGTSAYTEAIGKQHGWGWVVVGVPSIGIMLFAMIRLFKGVKVLTGLTMDDIMHPPAKKTVKPAATPPVSTTEKK
ncbi:MAG TPA: VC0807 family protein [Verrucomicrobiales bacterium]|nr:VC0807 family protein [Verrucomicrobiales bacterium]